MVKYFLPLLLVISLIIAGCTDKSDVTSPENKGGSVVLSIDKENAPAGIITVTASLTRQGYSPIVKAMNLLTDSSAALSMDNIPVGQWHLKVEAKDEASVVKYMGEKDVVISDGIITQISLTLMPTSTGMGGISIKVTWGTTTVKKWTDYSGNPILTGSSQFWDYNGIYYTKVLFEDGKYKLWYGTVTSGSQYYIGYATSLDGNTWTKYGSNPVFSPRQYGEWDYRIAMGSIIKDGNIYRMYYYGWSDQTGVCPKSIGLAISADGVNWERYGNPVMTGNPGGEDAMLVPTQVLKVDSLYYLYYNYKAVASESWKIGLATSFDGVHWTKYSGNPIITPTQSWEENAVGGASIIKDGDLYTMVYGCGSGSNVTAFGIAFSGDGKSWNKNKDNPIFKSNDPSIKWSVGKILHPHLIKTAKEYRIYYTGMDPLEFYFKAGYIRRDI